MENSNLNFVKPAWIYSINERQKMLPYQPYTVVPWSLLCAYTHRCGRTNTHSHTHTFYKLDTKRRGKSHRHNLFSGSSSHFLSNKTYIFTDFVSVFSWNVSSLPFCFGQVEGKNISVQIVSPDSSVGLRFILFESWIFSVWREGNIFITVALVFGNAADSLIQAMFDSLASPHPLRCSLLLLLQARLTVVTSGSVEKWVITPRWLPAALIKPWFV